MNNQPSADDSNAKPAKLPRELKVEDALQYLDQVKVEFSGKPHIYNEFLEIMKHFKAQEINTPGVIKRVRNLFRGYNKLILGFNTFLPEGYKIELTPDELAFESFETQQGLPSSSSVAPTGLGVATVQHTATSLSAASQPQSESAPTVPTLGVPGHARIIRTTNAPDISAQVPSVPIVGAPAVPSTAAAAPNKPPPQQMQQQHAITYVTQIRNRFSSDPETYRAFLKILHTYQKEQKGIKDVLEQVSHLFADHPDLLMEFTYFLPDSVQEQAKERLQRAATESEARKAKNSGGVAPLTSGISYVPRTDFGDGVHVLDASGMAAASAGFKRKINDKVEGDAGDGTAKVTKPRAKSTKRKSGDGAAGDGFVVDNPGDAQKTAIIAHAFITGNANMREVGSRKESAGDKLQLQHQSFLQQQHHHASGANQIGGLISSQGATGSGVSLAPINTSQGLGTGISAPSHTHVPYASHISVSEERKFFDNVQEYFVNNNSRENWIEFVKVLDMFSADVISKKDMFGMIQDLLDTDKLGDELFVEFKRLVNARGDYDASPHDVWYATPFSEIDFTQCRKCTPSYRALPKDYPKMACSDRKDLENSVLNDQWVSIPIGSEETYSFKHMRKNQYEEALFKCEDDRFEIDMIIDTNTSTIRVLEPIAEEISALKYLEESSTDAPKFSLQLEKRNFSTIHLNAITRIYGEHGNEILELLRKNPAGSIPIILKRLKQKDLEWRKARQELNKQWKEVIDKNFERSFDHRSFYFRQQDKRFYSVKHLVADIKGLSVESSGSSSSQGTGANSGSGNSINNTGNTNYSHSSNSSLSELRVPGVSLGLPANKPELEKGLKGIKPQLVMSYCYGDHEIHRDIYNILCHAVEFASVSISDKERITALWRDWLRIFFNIPVHYLYPSFNALASVSTAAGSGNSSSSSTINNSVLGSNGAATSSALNLTAKHFVSLQDAVPVDSTEAWSVGTQVVTLFGCGRVLAFRVEDSMYSIQLAFGTAYMMPSSIVGANELPELALKAIGVSKDETTGATLIYGKDLSAVSNDSVETPTASKVGVNVVEPPSSIFFGTQNCYAFLRMHHTLYTRLATAKQMCSETLNRHYNDPSTLYSPCEERLGTGRIHPMAQLNRATKLSASDHDGTEDGGELDVKVAAAVAVGVDGHALVTNPEDIIETITLTRPRPLYNTFLAQLMGLLDGSMDSNRYEESVRQLLGHKAYPLYTMDKAVQSALRTLQTLVNDDFFNTLVGIFIYYRSNATSECGVDSALYQSHVAQAMMYSSEEIYRLQLVDSANNTAADDIYVVCECLGVIQLPPPSAPGNAAASAGSAAGEVQVRRGRSGSFSGSINDGANEPDEPSDQRALRGGEASNTSSSHSRETEDVDAGGLMMGIEGDDDEDDDDDDDDGEEGAECDIVDNDRDLGYGWEGGNAEQNPGSMDISDD